MNIVYGIQTTGNGHLTKSAAIIQALMALGHSVEVILSGSQTNSAFAKTLFPKAIWVNGPTFYHKKGRVIFWKTLFCLRPIRTLRAIWRLSLTTADLVITDYEPITAWAAKLRGKFCLGISHQYAFSNKQTPFPRYAALTRLLLKYFAPPRLALGLHWHPYDTHILPPVVPAQLKHVTTTPSTQCMIVVYLPFESVQAIQQLLNIDRTTQFVIFHPAIQQITQTDTCCWQPIHRETFLTALSHANGFISNAGFEALSEALYLGKPILAKPLRGQAEQVANAMAIRQLKLGAVMTSLDTKQLSHWLTTLKANTTSHQWPNVAKRIANWIDQGDFSTVARLSADCWQVVL